MIIYKNFNALFDDPFNQYIFANKLKLFLKPIIYDKHIIQHKDLQYSSIDIQYGSKNKAVVLFHGFGGNSSSNYCTYIANHLKKTNTTLIIYNRRGHDLVCKQYPEHYIESDIVDVINYIKNLGYTDLYGIGVSLSTNIIIKYASKHNTFKKLILLACPFDISYCFERIKNDENVNTFLKMCSSDIANRCSIYLDQTLLDSCQTIQEQEGILLGKSEKDMKQYYMDMNCLKELKKINISTLIINSIDDPVLKIPIDKYKEYTSFNKNINIILTDKGSHCAWWNGEYMPNIFITNFFEL